MSERYPQGPLRQHAELATTGHETSEPPGGPTSDVFEGGKSAGIGRVYESDGRACPVSDYLPGEGGTAGSKY